MNTAFHKRPIPIAMLFFIGFGIYGWLDPVEPEKMLGQWFEWALICASIGIFFVGLLRYSGYESIERLFFAFLLLMAGVVNLLYKNGVVSYRAENLITIIGAGCFLYCRKIYQKTESSKSA